ncbi:protein kinase domain-containing protein [Streptomyces sp. NPDC126499]|uniref:serine/threonine-protein kinase n=1 Tax=Streptomyces sp. NPDC126499 TaxID=3155314 RepID=UPI00332D7D71
MDLAPPTWARAAAVETTGAETARTVGPFRVLHRLGAGGMGEVHLCVAPDGVLAAVKTVRPELLGEERIRHRFTREVQAARRVRNPYVVPVIAAETESAVPWLAQAFVPAPPVDHVVRHLGPLAEAVVRALGGGIAVALAGIHEAGIIHRDLKPGNVLLGADGPRVIDFGIARMEGRTLTVGEVWGTPGFMAPEQITDPDRLTGAADVFSLGVLLYYAATGRLPWRGSTALELQVQTVEGVPELSGLAPGLRELVAGCLARRPQDRPSPPELVAELGAEDVSASFGSALGRLRPALDSYARAVLHAVPDARVLGAMLDRSRDRRLRERIARLRERADGLTGSALPPWAVPGSAAWAGEVPKSAAAKLRQSFDELAREAADFYGPEDPEAFVLRAEEIRWRAEAGDPAQAAFELGELVESAAVALGPGAPEVLRLRRMRVTVLALAGNTSEAILLQEDVLRRVGDAVDPAEPTLAAAVAEARVELAELYGRAGRPESAARQYARALETARSAQAAPPAERIAQWRHQQAFWTRRFAPAEAVGLFRSLYEDCARELGPGHALTLEALEGVAYTLGAAGDAAAARDLYEELVPRARGRFGPDSLEALEAWASLAGWTGDAGDATRAARMYAEVVATAVERWGESHPRVTRWIREARVWRRRAAEQAPEAEAERAPEQAARPGADRQGAARTGAARPGAWPGADPPSAGSGQAGDAVSTAAGGPPVPAGRERRRSLLRWWPGRRRTTPSSARQAAPPDDRAVPTQEHRDRAVPTQEPQARGVPTQEPQARGVPTHDPRDRAVPAGSGPRASVPAQDLADRVHPVFLPPDRFPPALERVHRNVLPGLKTALAVRRGEEVSFVDPRPFSGAELESLWGSARRNVCGFEGLRTVRTETGDGDVIAELWHPDDVFVASRAIAPDWLGPALFGTPAPEGILLCLPQMRNLLVAPARPATAAELAGVLARVAADVHARASSPHLAVTPDVYLVARGRGTDTFQAQRVGRMVSGRPVVGGELLEMLTGR